MINTLKNIAFVVEEGAEDGHSDLGDHAARLAQAHDAHLIGIYAIDTASGHRASGHARRPGAAESRSITDAMPFIVPAEEVRVVVVDGDEDPRWKGADAGALVAEVLLEHACASQTDLLVIGAYSRSPMYQRLFGGVTTTLLAETPVPLLISD